MAWEFEPEFMQGGDNTRRCFILDAKAVLLYGADMQTNEFGCTTAEHELTAAFTHLNCSESRVAVDNLRQELVQGISSALEYGMWQVQCRERRL